MIHKVQKILLPGDKWVYYQLYIGIQKANEFLCDHFYPTIEILKQEEIIEKWFFIRYNDPEFHLRVRLELSDSLKVNEVVSAMNKCFSQPFSQEVIWDVGISTYKREVDRYGGKAMQLAEEVFFIDSEINVSILKNPNFRTKDFEWKSGVYLMFFYLNVFYPGLREKIQFMEEIRDAFVDEFELKKDLKIEIDRKYRELSNYVKQVIDNFNPVDSTYLSSLTKKLMDYNSLDFDYTTKVQIQSSLIHMSLNRLFSNRNREQEFICYDFLLRALKSKQAILRK
ncbi:thiopeptide-type bacteriocin biosynthesis protein [Allomuricauda sp. M10]|uniref:thiopeptide-type bacteriocin biosynthesis protein n=1 Tax=Allomuricauda sp. M10 TaxID=2683292 RepID=UPI001D185982|nr:thiopeptide-type bacteriocin biosynthesis protein [Muricauda sp. M10]